MRLHPMATQTNKDLPALIAPVNDLEQAAAHKDNKYKYTYIHQHPRLHPTNRVSKSIWSFQNVNVIKDHQHLVRRHVNVIISGADTVVCTSV